MTARKEAEKFYKQAIKNWQEEQNEKTAYDLNLAYLIMDLLKEITLLELQLKDHE